MEKCILINYNQNYILPKGFEPFPEKKPFREKKAFQLLEYTQFFKFSFQLPEYPQFFKSLFQPPEYP